MLQRYRQAKVNRSEKIVLTWNLNIHALMQLVKVFFKPFTSEHLLIVQ
jgi:hypothetical protein